jgi:hypothetical protein
MNEVQIERRRKLLADAAKRRGDGYLTIIARVIVGA